jgi:Type III restriction enzyme, res subunit
MNYALQTPVAAATSNALPPELESLNPETPQGAEVLEQVLPLAEFISHFGSGLLQAVQNQNPPVYQGQRPKAWDSVLDGLMRKPFEAQRQAVYAIAQLLIGDESQAGQPACVLNAEMGTGKTMMGLAAAAVLHQAGFERTLVIAPPHLVYKWRREIIQTVPHAKVWVLNGPDTLRKLLMFRAMREKPVHPEFFVLGRVRMRMGFNWKPAFTKRLLATGTGHEAQVMRVAACSHCGEVIQDEDNKPLQLSFAVEFLDKRRMGCAHCGDRLWTITRGGIAAKSRRDLVMDALQAIPSIGEKTALRLIAKFGDAMLASMLEDNFHNFINLMDDQGELIFNDRQARRMERFLGNNEISFGQGGYQPTEFIKRYLPTGYFGTLIVDEGHEYKNEGSAQGQAMGVLASQCKKVILLTGTLMGGYADDLFHLLFRMNPAMMMEDGYRYNERGSIGPAASAFMRDHGVLITTYKETRDLKSHRTARGEMGTPSVSKGPGFGPKGIMRYVVPITVFLKLKDIGGNVLPEYKEEFLPVVMDEQQRDVYTALACKLTQILKTALVAGDHSLLGVVLNCLLAWPDTAFRSENVYHPHRKVMLASAPSLYSDVELMPKERALIELCREERRQGRRVLVYTTYTGTRDTAARLKAALDQAGFKTAVLRATVEASKREDWVADQVERGVEVIVTNPELVKTGLDMLEFPTIVFMQTGYNVYTLQQAARRSWRIGQKMRVRVCFLGYEGTAQEQCLKLMGKKIAVSQSTSGDMPESGLDVLNQDGDSIEVALAKQLVERV